MAKKRILVTVKAHKRHVLKKVNSKKAKRGKRKKTGQQKLT